MKNQKEQLQPLDIPIRVGVSDEVGRKLQIQLSQNEYVNNNDAVGFLTSEADPITFLTYELQKEAEKEKLGPFGVTVTVALSNLKYQYERNVYTFFSLIGDVGGFNGAIVILPTLVITIYSEKMYKGDITEQIPTRKKKRKDLFENDLEGLK